MKTQSRSFNLSVPINLLLDFLWLSVSQMTIRSLKEVVTQSNGLAVFTVVEVLKIQKPCLQLPVEARRTVLLHVEHSCAFE